MMNNTMESNYVVLSNDRENNVPLVSMTTTNQMMPPAAHYSTDVPMTSLHVDNSDPYQMPTMYGSPIDTTPVVKSHQHIPLYSPPIGNYPHPQQTIETTNIMNNFNSMELDDFFAPALLDNNMFIYSPMSTSIATNNSSMMMDTSMSPTSPANGMSPIEYSQQSIDSFIAPNYQIMYPETPIVPTNIGMYPPPPVVLSDTHNNGRALPRRHTVSLPYGEGLIVDSLPPPPIKSRKSSLKAKRHRSLGKLDIYSDPPPVPDFEPLSAKLEHWTHEQLLERVKELEKEKVAAQQKQNKDERPPLLRKISNKVRSASQTDTEVEDDEDDEDGPHFCKWDTCTIEFSTLNELISHVKIDHIGSGKGSYYCGWKDCVRKQKPFTKKHKMHNHLRTHTGERPFACEEPDCGKKFSRLDSLTTHAKIHSNIRPYLCSVGECGKAYYHLRSLRKHERSHSQPKEEALSPPPLPSMATHPSLHPDSFMVSQEDHMSDWGLSAQAAVFDVMDRNSYL